MDLWVWWTIAGVAFAVGEMAIMGFALAPFAGGSFVAALFALAGAGTAVSIVVFAVITALLFLFGRPTPRASAARDADRHGGADRPLGDGPRAHRQRRGRRRREDRRRGVDRPGVRRGRGHRGRQARPGHPDQ